MTVAAVTWVLAVCIICYAAIDETRDAPPGQPPADPAGCGNLFIQLDKVIDHEEIKDIQETRIPGFPYYRVNRFLASFAKELPNNEALKEWLTRLLRLGHEGRRVEMANLPEHAFPDLPAEFASKDLIAEMERCAERLMAEDLSDPQRIKRIRDSVAVPDDYYTPVRVVGVNPVSRWIVTREILDLNDKARHNFQRPDAIGSSNILSYTPSHPRPVINSEKTAEILEQARSKSALGIPEPEPCALAQLFDYYAPVWKIGTSDDSDRIGRPFWQDDDRAGIDTKDPVVYRYHSFTRIHDQVLLQLNYLIWFPQRPSQGLIDIFSGLLDGLIWRVTLDQQGRVLLYDSVHPCGCYHKFYPVSPHLHPLEMPSTPEPPLILTQNIPNPENGRVVIHISSKEHYVVGLSTEQEQPEDFVIATGVQHSVRDFVDISAKTLGIDITWQGRGANEKGIDTKTGKTIVEVDPKYFRPTEVETLLGNPAKAKEKLGWTPKITFGELVSEMVKHDLEEAKRDDLCKNHGFSTFDYNE